MTALSNLNRIQTTHPWLIFSIGFIWKYNIIHNRVWGGLTSRKFDTLTLTSFFALTAYTWLFIFFNFHNIQIMRQDRKYRLRVMRKKNWTNWVGSNLEDMQETRCMFRYLCFGREPQCNSVDPVDELMSLVVRGLLQYLTKKAIRKKKKNLNGIVGWRGIKSGDINTFNLLVVIKVDLVRRDMKRQETSGYKINRHTHAQKRKNITLHSHSFGHYFGHTNTCIDSLIN